MIIKISDLIQILPKKEVFGDAERNIAKIEYDSRLIKPEDMFVAMPGSIADGHDYIDDAIKAGAVCIVCEKDFENNEVCKVIVPDSRHALSLLAAKFYNFPSRKLKVAGITGTNGKTTTVYMVKSIFDERLKRTGLIGTIEYLAGQYQFTAFNTTPESLHIERLLSVMQAERIRNVVMEVSSHGLKTGRVRMIDFNVVGFTNLTQDHLDFHGTMEEYREAKAILIDKVKGKDKWAVLNMDDPNYDFFLSRAECSYLAYSMENPKADLRITDVEKADVGYKFKLITPLGTEDVHLKLPGRYNLNNVLCAAGVAMASGVDAGTVKLGLEAMRFVPGRMEKIDTGREFNVYVDFAHTPDALGHVMKSAKEIAGDKRLIAVFGCGGDRDKEKRPLMSKAVSEHADIIFLTSDNPRTENPEAIINDAKAGLNNSRETHVVLDRKEAITEALGKASEGDVVVIAGKGHENYQVIGEEKTHFDDREVIREVLKG
ncbi:MAG: UDP-N-acetylmuramoyl-L-alanyl-D-glutamate--2,6-diaminopimelate ligase [candidate division Zixibacteria bacterium]|nr:UDP-N-acetylmuramoyl-L-alanyl-D-glutamate--2,6-diaminopimelate ligase [candidate division Zixibacteria bacterium]